MLLVSVGDGIGVEGPLEVTSPGRTSDSGPPAAGPGAKQPDDKDAGRILTNTAYRALADVGSKVASIVLFVFMARELGNAQFGIFTFGLSFVTLVTILGGFGQDAVLTREVARDRERIHRYFGNVLALKVLLAVPALSVAVGITVATAGEQETRLVVLVLGIAVIAELLMNTCFAVFQAYERLAFVPIALISQRYFTAGAGVIALLAGAQVVAISIIYLAGASLGLAIALFTLFRYVERPSLELSLRSLWPLFRATVPVGLVAIFAMALFRADMTMLAFFKPADVVGDYGASFRLLEATLFLSWAVNAAVYPVFSRLTRTTEPPVGNVFERAIKLAVALTMPLAVGAAVLAHPLVSVVYGPDYREAGRALLLLAPTIALYPVAFIAGTLLVAQNRHRAVTIVYGLVAAQNILLNLILIPAYSLDGAAVGTSISQLLLTIPLVVFAQRAAGTVRWFRALAGPLLASAIAGVAMLVLADAFAAAVVVGSAAYLVALMVWERAMFPQDARTIWAFLRRRREAT